MTHYNVDGLRYHVVQAGSGEPLVLLHGFTGSGLIWRDLITRLGATHRLITIDLPGHGRTDSPADIERYRIERVASDLTVLLGKVGVRSAHFLGYSMGGRLTLYFAVHYPALVRSLILESASPGLAGSDERQARQIQDENLARRIETDGVAAFIYDWERLPLFASQSRLPATTRDRVHRQRLDNSAIGLARSLRGMGTGAQPSLWDELGAMTQPALLLTGALDVKFTAINRRMSAAIADSQFMIMPDAGHTIHLEQPVAFAGAVLNFLKAVSSPETRQPLAEAEQGYKC